MYLKTTSLLAVLFFVAVVVSGQFADTAKLKREQFNSYEELRAKQKKAGIDTLFYLDSTFGFSARVPGWLDLKETGSADRWGGIIQDAGGFGNAILVTGFPKSAFKSFDEFKTIYLTGNKFGQPTKYSSEHIWYGQNDLINMRNGVKQKVFTFWRNKIYYHMFVLLESTSAYLWIQFTSTPESYDLNISKFNEFMAGFKLTGY